MRRLLALSLAAFVAGPAAACLNDVELPTHEREFRSQYRDPAPTPVAAEPGSLPAGRPVALGAGVVFLAGGLAVSLLKPAARG